MTDEELDAIRIREQEHWLSHLSHGSALESCLPGGCGEDNDVAKLIAEVDRLRGILGRGVVYHPGA